MRKIIFLFCLLMVSLIKNIFPQPIYAQDSDFILSVGNLQYNIDQKGFIKSMRNTRTDLSILSEVIDSYHWEEKGGYKIDTSEVEDNFVQKEETADGNKKRLIIRVINQKTNVPITKDYLLDSETGILTKTYTFATTDSHPYLITVSSVLKLDPAFRSQGYYHYRSYYDEDNTLAFVHPDNISGDYPVYFGHWPSINLNLYSKQLQFYNTKAGTGLGCKGKSQFSGTLTSQFS